MDEAQNETNDLEHKKAKNNQSEQQEEKKNPKKNEDSINSLWDNFKRSNICIIGRRKSKKLEIYLKKIVKENSSDLLKERVMHVQEAQRIPNKMHAKRLSPKTHHN